MAPEPRDTQYQQRPTSREDVTGQGDAAANGGATAGGGAPPAAPDEQFTNLQRVSSVEDSSTGRGEHPAEAGDHTSFTDKARSVKERAKEKFDTQQDAAKSKFRRAFRLKVSHQCRAQGTVRRTASTPLRPSVISSRVLSLHPWRRAYTDCKEVIRGHLVGARYRQIFRLLHLQQEREDDPSLWMCGTLYITVHEADSLPGDPTLVGVSLRATC